MPEGSNQVDRSRVAETNDILVWHHCALFHSFRLHAGYFTGFLNNESCDSCEIDVLSGKVLKAEGFNYFVKDYYKPAIADLSDDKPFRKGGWRKLGFCLYVPELSPDEQYVYEDNFFDLVVK